MDKAKMFILGLAFGLIIAILALHDNLVEQHHNCKVALHNGGQTFTYIGVYSDEPTRP